MVLSSAWLLVVLGTVFQGPAQVRERSPREVFLDRLPGVLRGTGEPRGVHGLTGTLPRAVGPLNDLLGPAEPSASFDAINWAEAKNECLPLQWDGDRSRFRAVREMLHSESSEAVVRFAWRFLRSYDGLDPALREAHAPLAIGAAGLVASEALHGTTQACLPIEVLEPSAIVCLLSHYEPELPRSCFRGDAKRRAELIRKAYAAMARTDAKPGDAPAVDLAWLEAPHEEAAGKRLVDLLPTDPAALEGIVNRISGRSGIGNLTIRAWIVAACSAGRFAGQAEEAMLWQGELQRLLPEIRAELSAREVERIATRSQAGAIRAIASDPGLLRPLMVIAGQAAKADLRAAAAAERPGEALIAALWGNPATRSVLDLAGSDPEIQTHGADADGERSVSLTWGGLLRESPRGRRASGVESVSIDLVLHRPAGSGRPITGLGLGTLVAIPEGEGERRVRVESLKLGMRVRGFVHIDPPTTAPDRFVAEPAPERSWFTVVDARRRTLPECFRLEMEEGATLLVGTGQRILMASGEDLGWSDGRAIDPGSSSWYGGPGRRLWLGRQVAAAATDQREAVELTLTHETRRGIAHNVAIYPSEEGPGLVVEARAVDAGPIAADAPILLGDGSATVVGEIVTEAPSTKAVGESIGRAPATVLAGFTLRSDEPWPIAAVQRHETLARVIEDAPVESAEELEFETGRLVVGPNNWLLVLVNGEVAERPVRKVLPGDSVVAEWRDGQPIAIRLKGKKAVATSGRRFVRLAVNNTPWVRVGPVLVGVEHEERDRAVEGFSPRVGLSRPRRTDAGDCVASREPWPLSAGVDVFEVLVLDRERMRFDAGKVEASRSTPTTRTVVVTVGLNGQIKQVELGPGQRLFAVRRDATGEQPLPLLPAELRPRSDSILVAEPGAAAALPWAVEKVETRFHARSELVGLKTGPRPDRLKSPGVPDVVFAEGMSAILPRIQSKSQPLRDRAGAEETGAGAGGGDSGIDRGQASKALASEAGVEPDLGAAGTTDVIKIPEAGLAQLVRRGEELSTLFESESGGLRAEPRDDHRAMLKYWERLLARPGEPEIGAASRDRLNEWFRAVLLHRTAFLNAPATEKLPPLLLEEVILASWLRAFGASRTSERLTQDLVELSIYAGCEPRRGVLRLGRGQGIHHMMLVPGFLLGKDTRELSVGDEALVVAASLLEGEPELKGPIQRGRIPLRGLFTIWARGQSWRNLWMKLPAPNADGTLPTDEPGWYDFDRWARTQAKALEPDDDEP